MAGTLQTTGAWLRSWNIKFLAWSEVIRSLARTAEIVAGGVADTVEKLKAADLFRGDALPKSIAAEKDDDADDEPEESPGQPEGDPLPPEPAPPNGADSPDLTVTESDDQDPEDQPISSGAADGVQ